MKLSLNIKGMHCKSCEELIKEDLQDMNVKADVDHKTGILNIEFDENKTKLDNIKEAIKKLGYKVE
ncbi:MAG: heavy-metal-associated domain-containing protein [Nanoarchaeota archaeon]